MSAKNDSAGRLARLDRERLGSDLWGDLAKASANVRLTPVSRAKVERRLQGILPELSVGERVALARSGSRGVISLLLDETDRLVLRALAGNPRLTESDVTTFLARTDLCADFLGWLADSSSWGRRPTVRLALVRHANTPAASSLRLTRGLSARDIDDLRRDAAAPRLVRVAAERLLAETRGRRAASSPSFG